MRGIRIHISYTRFLIRLEWCGMLTVASEERGFMRDTDYISDVKYLCGLIIICIVALIAFPIVLPIGAGYLMWKTAAKRMWSE
jgi:hypothetical protein